MPTKRKDIVKVDPGFAPVVEAFAKDQQVSYGRMFASMGLKVNGKIFAMLASVLFAVLAAQEAPLEMKTYYVVFLRKVPNQSALDTAEAKKRQDDHLAHLARLNRDGVSVLYGPFLDEGDVREIAVLNVASADEARARLAEDPHVQAGALALDVKPWMAPKGWFHPPVEPQQLENLVFGLLVRGPRASIQRSPEEAKALQKAHLAYMEELAKQGKLVAAGPFLDNSELRGVVIYRVGTVEEARRLASEDPAVKAGRLVIEARPWTTLRGILK